MDGGLEMAKHVDVVMAYGPGPVGDFIETEVEGRGVRCGEWIKRPDDLWALRITPGDIEQIPEEQP
jgi:hypothetical protein